MCGARSDRTRTPGPAQGSRSRRDSLLASALSGDIGQVLWTLSLGAALVLLVACANVTALLLGRAMTRERETAIRLALGPGPGRVLRALSVEALLLALAGSLAGAAAAAVGISDPSQAGGQRPASAGGSSC